MENRGKIVEEHFWSAATTMAVNAFIMSAHLSPSQVPWAKGVSAIISLYAAFLIGHRSAAHADKLHYPGHLSHIPESDKQPWHKAQETWCHVKLFPRHLLFVICEFSGALFYLILVVISHLGVWLVC